MSTPENQRVITIWPLNPKWQLPTRQGSGPWYQDRRWCVLDVTDGMERAVVLARGDRWEMLDKCLELRFGGPA